MKKTILLFTVLLFSLLISTNVFADENVCAYYFYGDGCHFCAQTTEFLDQIEEQYPSLELHKFEVWYNQENSQTLQKYFDAYDVPEGRESRGVPALFIGENYYIGLGPIVQNLETEIQNGPTDCPTLQDINGTGDIGSKTSTESFGLETILIIIGAALVDSINPCAIAVILILLTSLIVVGRKRALTAGLAFIISIYIVYFLFGLGLFSLFQFILIPLTVIGGILRYFIGTIAIIVGILNIKDFIWYGGGGFVIEIPRSWRPRMKKLIMTATSPISAFVIGFLVSLFELPCTGGPYFFVTGYLADKFTFLGVIPILLFYNLFFIMPLIIINLVIYFGYVKIDKAQQWRTKNLRNLHLAAGIIMILLGLAIIPGILY